MFYTWYQYYARGYTGHCPTLRFHYGTCYGSKTKEILQELRDNRVLQDVQRFPYRAHDPGKVVLQPLPGSKEPMKDYFLNTQYRAPRYIIGYTGFVPTLNFRYGKSYGRAADDSMCEFNENQRKMRDNRTNMDRMFRAKSAPKMDAIRAEDEVQRTLREYEEKTKYRAREITADYPPIAGYTGHIPRVKGNEESLSQRYNTVVKRGLSLLQQERDKQNALRKPQNKITDILQSAEGAYTYKDI